MKALFYLFLLWAAYAQVCSDNLKATTMDFTGSTQVQGQTLDKLICNAQTRIDFNFGQAAADHLNVTISSGNYYTFVSAALFRTIAKIRFSSFWIGMEMISDTISQESP